MAESERIQCRGDANLSLYGHEIQPPTAVSENQKARLAVPTGDPSQHDAGNQEIVGPVLSTRPGNH